MKELTKERMGEIALAILKNDSRKDRIPDLKELKRVLGNAEKSTGIPGEELLSFWIIIYSEIFTGIISEAQKIYSDQSPKQPSPLRVVGEKIKGFLNFKK